MPNIILMNKILKHKLKPTCRLFDIRRQHKIQEVTRYGGSKYKQEEGFIEEGGAEYNSTICSTSCSCYE